MQIGQEMSLMRISDMHKAARTPQVGRTKKLAPGARPGYKWKTKSFPTETVFNAQVYALFAEAAHSGKGRGLGMKGINDLVRRSGLTGLDTGATQYHKEDADLASQGVPAKIARWRAMAGGRGARMGYRQEEYVPERF